MAELFRVIHARERELWEIRLAVSTKDYCSPSHPNNIRAEIKRLESLLKEASV